ncbi:hypothetical protein BaRGS_00007825, partial [Batillaria attramentaria]
RRVMQEKSREGEQPQPTQTVAFRIPIASSGDYNLEDQPQPLFYFFLNSVTNHPNDDSCLMLVRAVIKTADGLKPGLIQLPKTRPPTHRVFGLGV